MVKGKSKTSEDLKAKPKKKKKSQIYQNQNGDMCRFTLVSGNSKPLHRAISSLFQSTTTH